MRRDDNLTILMCRMSGNLVTSTIWKPLGLTRELFMCIWYKAYCRVYLAVLHFRHLQISPKACARFTTFTIYKRYKSCDPLKEFYPFFEFSYPLFHQILPPHLYISLHHDFTLLLFVLYHKSSKEILQIPSQFLRTTSTFGHLANKFSTFC